jgi:hypothetical protein
MGITTFKVSFISQPVPLTDELVLVHNFDVKLYIPELTAPNTLTGAIGILLYPYLVLAFEKDNPRIAKHEPGGSQNFLTPPIQMGDFQQF